MGKKGYLILENGDIFAGISFGKETDVNGEVVFNTGMTGYPEGFTDPSYCGQILTCTYPLIGNYGVPPEDKTGNIPEFLESEKIQIRGLLVSSYVPGNNHWQSEESLSFWLKKEGIPAISGIDTRTLTKTLREFGVMKGIITFKDPRQLAGISFYDINRDNLVAKVSCQKSVIYGNGKMKLLLIDCGLKYSQIKLLLKLDTTVIRVPWNFNPFKARGQTFKEIQGLTPFDAIIISNGPGDPKKA
ncbi:carbamoyl phosphate synthase large subunit, partial [Candidatus Gottesmanbacteria bacterium]|nr:carbamoyl phosphate synthase large subunit [Candidatus Gottesmanbacteria bacterium]